MELRNDKGPLTPRDLYPSLNDEQVKEAEQNLRRYLELVVMMCEHRLDVIPAGGCGLTHSAPEVGSEDKGRNEKQPSE